MFKGAAAKPGLESRPWRALAALTGGVTRVAAKSASLIAAFAVLRSRPPARWPRPSTSP